MRLFLDFAALYPGYGFSRSYWHLLYEVVIMAGMRNSTHLYGTLTFLLALILGCFIFKLAQFVPFGMASWFVWFALLVSLLKADTLPSYLTKLSVTVIAVVATTLIWPYVAFSFMAQAVCFFLLSFAAWFLYQKYPDYFFSSVLIILFNILLCMQHMLSSRALHLACTFLIAGIFVMVWQLITWRYNRLLQYAYLTNAFRLISKKWLNDIFSCMLDAEYHESPMGFEEHLHADRHHALQLTKQIHHLKSSVGAKEQTQVNKNVQLFDAINADMLAMARLRYRTKDHQSYAYFKDDLVSLKQTITNLIMQKQDAKIHVKHALDRFESNYHSILQTVASEPLAILLFIVHLRALIEHIIQLNEESKS